MAVEAKTGLSEVRGLRDALVQLAGYLAEQPKTRGILLLIEPRITHSRIQEEWLRLRAALRAELGERLDIVASRGERFEGLPRELSEGDQRILERLVTEKKRKPSLLSRPAMRSEVMRVLILQWIQSRGPVTSRWLQEAVGCNYRTVAAALERLGRAVRRHSDRRVELRHFPKEEWAKLLATADAARGTRRYAYTSDQPRSSESLFRRLQALKIEDLAVGGVLGARYYYPDFDLLGTPRLDLCIHSPGDSVDLDFVHRLDPALQHTREPGLPARLVLHFVRRKTSFFKTDEEAMPWADPVECLLDLHEARLESQADGFLRFLTAKREGSLDRHA